MTPLLFIALDQTFKSAVVKWILQNWPEKLSFYLFGGQSIVLWSVHIFQNLFFVHFCKRKKLASTQHFQFEKVQTKINWQSITANNHKLIILEHLLKKAHSLKKYK